MPSPRRNNHKNCILKFIRGAWTASVFLFVFLIFILLCDAFKMFINTVNLLSTFELATCVRLRLSSCKMSRGQRQRLIIMQPPRPNRVSDTLSSDGPEIGFKSNYAKTYFAAIATTPACMSTQSFDILTGHRGNESGILGSQGRGTGDRGSGSVSAAG